MCYEFDTFFFNRARAAEKLRGKKEKSDEPMVQSETETPAKAAEPEKQVKERETVPA